MKSRMTTKAIAVKPIGCFDRRNFVDCAALADGLAVRITGWLVALFITIFSPVSASADETSAKWSTLQWRYEGTANATNVTHETGTHDDQTVERFRLQNRGTPELLQVRAFTEPSLLHDEFEATVKVHSNVSGIKLGLLILLPHQLDPRTGKPLQTILQGDVVREADVWHELRVRATPKSVEALLRRIRLELNQGDIQRQDAIALGLVLIVEATPGEVYFDAGPVKLGTMILLNPGLAKIAVANTTDEKGKVHVRQFIPLDVELDAILLNRKPVILRFAPDHSEDLETLQKLGLNSAWVPNYQSTERAKALYESGFAVLATPPHPEFEPGDFSRLLHSLPPLDQQCPNVSAWYEGTRVSPDELKHLLAWSREIRSADRAFQRLQMADVTGAEGAVAREIDLVGVGRHVIGRDESLGALRNLLIRKQKDAGQLSFPWTWIQTEPSSTQQAWRTSVVSQSPFVEPEQIQHQIYAAISAGFKGIGFWKTHQLNMGESADRETALAIELACLEIQLLEPFLARGRIDGYLALQSGAGKDSARGSGSGKSGQATPFLKSALGGRSIGSTSAGTEAPSEHDATVISSSGSTLILATAWDNVSQFVPGPMFEREVNLVVAASETASAWQISTSGIQPLVRERTAGGLSLRIKSFDRSAAVIVSSNTKLIESLTQRIHAMAQRSATQTHALASLKYLRVLETVEALRDEHTVPPGVDALLSSAKQSLTQAEFELNNNDFQEASLKASDTLRLLRQAQQVCWKDAIAELTSPTASPHTISFATLPDHWKLMHYLDQQSFRMTANLLPAGDFEDAKSLAQDGWRPDVPAKSPYSATAEKIQDGRSGKTLRMIAWHSDPTITRTVRDDMTPLLVTTPVIDVVPQDVVIVSGRVRKGRTTPSESKRPLIIFDSELGPEHGIRTELDSEWTTFEMIRPIGNSSEFTVSFGLMGQAEVHIDDLQIRRLPSLTSSGPVRLTGSEAVEDFETEE